MKSKSSSEKSFKFREAVKKTMILTIPISNIMPMRALCLLQGLSYLALEVCRLVSRVSLYKGKETVPKRWRAYLRLLSKSYLNLTRITTLKEMDTISLLAPFFYAWSLIEPLLSSNMHILNL